MTNKTIRLVLRSTLPLMILSVPFMANAELIAGKLVGYNCAVRGEICPTSKLDPHLAVEPDFVLVDTKGDHYFLTNLNRDIKVRYVLEEVQVNGDLIQKYRSVTVDELKVKQDDDYKTVWSKDLQIRAYKDEENEWERYWERKSLHGN